MKKLKMPAFLSLATALVVLVAGLAFWFDSNNGRPMANTAVGATHSGHDNSGHSAAAATPFKSEGQRATSPTTNATIVDVDISGFQFSPKTITVTAGTVVRWTNKDTALHNVTSNPAGTFASGDLSLNQTFVFTFTQVGTFNYRCTRHGSMTATVVVVPDPTPTVNVDIKSFQFTPQVLTVTVGTRVRWTNKDTALHTVTSNPAGAFDSGDLAQNQSFDFIFNQVGTFDYRCTRHGSMTATIIVIDAPVVQVDINGTFFTPNLITVPVGTKVRWVFNASGHNVSGSNADQSVVFRSGNPGDVQVYEFTFTKADLYDYVCEAHLSSMRGTVVVVDYVPIDFVAPSTVEVNSPLTLSVGGQSFRSGSLVYLNGTPLSPTTFITGTELQAVVPANLLTTPSVATITVTNPLYGQPSNPLSLTICDPLTVTSSNTVSSDCGTLNRALQVAAQSSQPTTITLAVAGGTLTLNSPLNIPPNTTLRSADCANRLTLNGGNINGPGLTLSSNAKLQNLRIIGFKGVQISVPNGGGNHLECVKAERIAG